MNGYAVTEHTRFSTNASDVEPSQPLVDRESQLTAAQQLLDQRDFDASAKILNQVLVANPTDYEAVFMLANCKAASGQLEAAIEIIGAIPQDHPEAGLPALGQAADWCMSAGKYEEAEANYKKVLTRTPYFTLAHRQLAFLLNRQGRRHEAAQHIRQLCLLGDVRQDELHALSSISDAVYDPVESSSPSNVSTGYFPIGDSGESRKAFTDGRFRRAFELIEQDVLDGKAPDSLFAFYGRLVAEGQDDSRFAWWLKNAHADLHRYSEYWSAIGVRLMQETKYEQASRAFLESIDRDPSDLRTISRLQMCLRASNQTELAETWSQRWEQSRDLIRANNIVADSTPPHPDSLRDLADRLEQMGRRIEAVMWRFIEGRARGLSRDQLEKLNKQRLLLVRARTGFPSRAERLSGTDPEDFPDPKDIHLDSQSKPRELTRGRLADKDNAAPKFQNIAKTVGMDHTFRIGSRPQRDGFAIYQLVGGGVGALDFDLDGLVDLCFCQGAADPPTFRATDTNALIRNLGESTIDVSASAALIDKHYTIGLTCGDWNQDGFCDILFANLSSIDLLLNNGDGSFAKRSLDRSSPSLMPTSLGLGDVNADGLPDLVVAHYVDDDAIAVLPRRDHEGKVIKMLLPTDFSGGKDVVLLNSVDGIAKSASLETSTTNLGLGVVIGDILDSPGNELFVGNDLGPNQLWSFEPSSGTWQDVAAASGCAFGFTGAATASMGIAAADIDGNHKIDFHVTNFANESASLFLQSGQIFRDQNVRFRLDEKSREVLGFGTQAIDFNNDSLRDFVVTNGNIDDAVQFESPFEQPAQLFANRGAEFELVDVDDPSGYWSRAHLGRGLARLDFNRDGRMDFVVTHINEPSALLVNQTETTNHWVQIELVGTRSERDAIGARVTIRYEGQASTDWQVAGDGYLAKNESLIAFGLGFAENIDSIEIKWPSGLEESISDVDIDTRVLVVEGLGKATTLNEVR